MFVAEGAGGIAGFGGGSRFSRFVGGVGGAAFHQENEKDERRGEAYNPPYVVGEFDALAFARGAAFAYAAAAVAVAAQIVRVVYALII